MTDNSDINNGISQVTDIIPKDEIDTSESKESKFAMEYLDCHDVREAGRRAGYSATVLTSGYLYGKFKNPRFQEIFRGIAIARDYQDMAFVYSLERKALKEAVHQAKDKPESALENLSKLKRTVKEKKQIIGLLSPDTSAPPQTINVAVFERVQIAMSDMLAQRLLKHPDTDNTKQ